MWPWILSILFFQPCFLGLGNRRKRRKNTYICQSSRAVPSLYLMYADKAFNTPSAPPLWKSIPRCMEKIDLYILSDLVLLELRLFPLLPSLKNLARKIASAAVFFIKFQSSLDLYNWLLFINSFKASSAGMVPNDFTQLITQAKNYLSWLPQYGCHSPSPKEKFHAKNVPQFNSSFEQGNVGEESGGLTGSWSFLNSSYDAGKASKFWNTTVYKNE